MFLNFAQNIHLGYVHVKQFAFIEAVLSRTRNLCFKKKEEEKSYHELLNKTGIEGGIHYAPVICNHCSHKGGDYDLSALSALL